MIPSMVQGRAINWGLPQDQRQWEWVDMPVGPQPLPPWARGLKVNWMIGYCNSPHAVLKTNTDLRSWPDKRFEVEGSRYMARHTDGRAEVYYHSGPLGYITLKRPRGAAGRFSGDGKKYVMRQIQNWEEYEAIATSPQEGFGGMHVPVIIGGRCRKLVAPVGEIELRGREVVLRGPWHGGPPPGYQEISYINVADRDTRRYMENSARSPRWRHLAGWEQQTARAGLYLRDDVFVRIVARFLPWCRLASVTYAGYTSLDLVHPEWPSPKQWLPREMIYPHQYKKEEL